jgi:hypothetical protein
MERDIRKCRKICFSLESEKQNETEIGALGTTYFWPLHLQPRPEKVAEEEPESDIDGVKLLESDSKEVEPSNAVVGDENSHESDLEPWTEESKEFEALSVY